MIRYAYLHGFASSASSYKGVELAKRFAALGAVMERPDLNAPSFTELTYSGALGVMDALHQQEPEARWHLIGSSMGGYLASRWAQLHPERVERLILLCPGFDLVSRWPVLLGEKALSLWERWGTIRLNGPTGELTPIAWGFIEDARTHPPIPEVTCDTLIIHGVHDTIVPIASSREYASRFDHVRLIEVDSDHGLVSALPDIERETLEFFALEGSG